MFRFENSKYLLLFKFQNIQQWIRYYTLASVVLQWIIYVSVNLNGSGDMQKLSNDRPCAGILLLPRRTCGGRIGPPN